MIDSYRLLLEKAARLYEKYEAGRPEPFNVFSVLRSEHDEVNLHSRFLHALLDYRQPSDEHRENLEDFLCSIVGIDKLDLDGTTVKRESDNIDILIRDRSSMQAVVIENKIWAGDQQEQLWRYAKRLKKQGYTPHLLYLTLDGHDPSENSVGGLDPKCIKCISYKENLPPWLKRCQKRAYDEPALRESVAQYLHLIEKLTGTDYKEAYMTDLKELFLKDEKNLNLVLVHDLQNAMTEARVSLLHKLWQEIDHKLREEISDLPQQLEKSDISKKTVKGFVTGTRGYSSHGLYYTFRAPAALAVIVEGNDSFCFGVICENNEAMYNELRNALHNALEGGRYSKGWPWWKYPSTNPNLRNPTREDLKLLAKLLTNEQERQSYVAEVVCGVGKLWRSINDSGLA